MVVRLGAAICAAAMAFGCSSPAFASSRLTSLEMRAAEECLSPARKASDARAAACKLDDPAALLGKVTSRRTARPNEAQRGAPITGVASTYNPFRAGWREGGRYTASGERYDPVAWTAAIKITLRDKFGGVHYGPGYRPVYALVESDDKHVIVRINDVGPLKPGRVIDLNERTMRYFDPVLERGLIRPVKVTPLLGTSWTPGPVRTDG